MRPNIDWPPVTKPFRTSPPEGAAGIVLPIRDDLRFFKLCYHSILAFTDYRFMLTIVDNMSGFNTRQYLESIRRNHNINVLQYQKEHNLAAEWNLGLRYMFSFSTVKYGVALTPTIVVEPYWLSALVRAVATGVGATVPASQYASDALLVTRESFETLGGFNESATDPATDFTHRLVRSPKGNFGVSPAGVHKFRVNGFDPKTEESKTTVREKEEVQK